MTLTIECLRIPEIRLITAVPHKDERGSFCETWNQRELAELGIDSQFVQDNHVISTARGTIRGLHYQAAPDAQGKLLRVLRGRIFDVAVDLRLGSRTFGQWVAAELDSTSGQQIWIPAGFAHGYCTLEPQTEVLYKVDAYYNPTAEGGVRWNDPDIGIDWPDVASTPILSPKDRILPTLADWLSNASADLDHFDSDNYVVRTALSRAQAESERVRR